MQSILSNLNSALATVLCSFETKYTVEVDGESHARLKEAVLSRAVAYCPIGTNHLLGVDAYKRLGLGKHYGLKGELLHVVGSYADLRAVLADVEVFALARAVGATTVIVGPLVLNLSFGSLDWDQGFICKAAIGCIHSALHM